MLKNAKIAEQNPVGKENVQRPLHKFPHKSGFCFIYSKAGTTTMESYFATAKNWDTKADILPQIVYQILDGNLIIVVGRLLTYERLGLLYFHRVGLAHNDLAARSKLVISY